MKISKILHYAADHYLWDGGIFNSMTHSEYSCDAIERAIYTLIRKNHDMYFYIIFKGLGEMGLDVSRVNFKEFSSDAKQQGARYAWLKFAAMIAEEQGV